MVKDIVMEMMIVIVDGTIDGVAPIMVGTPCDWGFT